MGTSFTKIRVNIHYFEVKNDVSENLCEPLCTLPYVKMMYCFELLFLDQLLTRQRRLEVWFIMSCDHPDGGVAHNSKVL